MMNMHTDVTEALRRQVEELNEAPIQLADVQAKARRIQRRRRAAGAVAAAAVVAIVSPVGYRLIGTEEAGAPQPVGHPSQTVQQTAPTPHQSSPDKQGPRQVSEPSPPRDTVPIDLGNANLLRSETGIPYWSRADSALEPVTGLPLTPSTTEVYNPVQLDGGEWIGITFAHGEYSFVRLDKDGNLLERAPSPGLSIAVTPDGTAYAWLSRDKVGGQDVWRVHAGGAREQSWALDQAPEPGAGVRGILPDGSVVFDTAAGSVWLARPDGSITALPGDALSAASVSGVTGAIAVQQLAGGQSCGAVLDSSGATTAQECDYQLGEFSPDGKYIAGYQSSATNSWVAILDAASLQPVQVFLAPKGASIDPRVTWVGDDLLTQVFDDGRWSLMRLFREPQQGPGGEYQTAGYGGPKPGDSLSLPYEFGAGPRTQPNS